MITDKTISLDAIRTLAETSLDTKRALQTMYPDVFAPPLKAGDIVSKRDKNTGKFIFGVVAGVTVSKLVSEAYYGHKNLLFVIVGNGDSYSYRDAAVAAEAGWTKVLVPGFPK